jgi:hypothetical protein
MPAKLSGKADFLQETRAFSQRPVKSTQLYHPVPARFEAHSSVLQSVIPLPLYGKYSGLVSHGFLIEARVKVSCQLIPHRRCQAESDPQVEHRNESRQIQLAVFG